MKTLKVHLHCTDCPSPISSQVYSLFDDSLPKPTVHASKFRLPDCYNVTNVQPIETKTLSFNEETLFWIFYSCPADVKQQMAAQELYASYPFSYGSHAYHISLGILVTGAGTENCRSGLPRTSKWRLKSLVPTMRGDGTLSGMPTTGNGRG